MRYLIPSHKKNQSPHNKLTRYGMNLFRLHLRTQVFKNFPKGTVASHGESIEIFLKTI